MNKTIDGYKLVIHAPLKAASLMDIAKIDITQTALYKIQYANSKEFGYMEKVFQKFNAGTESLDEIENMLKFINDFDITVSKIADSVEEQSVSTNEIFNNISQVSSGIQEVNMTVGQSSTAAQDITQDISKVSDQVEEMANGTNQLDARAKNIETTATTLIEIVDQFKI